MSLLTTFDNVQSLIERVNQSPTPAFCARVTVDWLVSEVGASAVVLLREGYPPNFILHDTVQPDVGTIAWLQTDASWHTLLTASRRISDPMNRYWSIFLLSPGPSKEMALSTIQYTSGR